MNKYFRFKAVLVGLIIMIISLAGCGGGGGGSTPVYKILGVGVIMESKSAINLSGISKSSYFKPAWKRIELSLNSVAGVQTQSALKFRAAKVTDAILNDNISFIFLTWDVVSGADHYRVLYNGEIVWESDKEHKADPTFELSNPQAYLDLDDELEKKITTAGLYEFQIVALNGDTVKTQLPKVTASLGRVLETLPKNVSFTSPNLRWDAVTAASEYKITIDGVKPIKVNQDLTTFDVATILTASSQYYDVWVDARYLDDSGNLVEITRGIGGLTY